MSGTSEMERATKLAAEINRSPKATYIYFSGKVVMYGTRAEVHDGRVYVYQKDMCIGWVNPASVEYVA